MPDGFLGSYRRREYISSTQVYSETIVGSIHLFTIDLISYLLLLKNKSTN